MEEPTHADVGNDEEEADPDRNWPIDVHLLPVLVLELVKKFSSLGIFNLSFVPLLLFSAVK
jgi:hypothetical protein